MRLYTYIYSTIRRIASVDDMIQIMIVGYLPTKLQAMLLLFKKSECLECAKVVVLKLGANLFYSGIHFKLLIKL